MFDLMQNCICCKNELPSLFYRLNSQSGKIQITYRNTDRFVAYFTYYYYIYLLSLLTSLYDTLKIKWWHGNSWTFTFTEFISSQYNCAYISMNKKISKL